MRNPTGTKPYLSGSKAVRALTLGVVLFGASVGCSVEEAEDGVPVGQDQSQIIGGTLDTENDAVVQIFGGGAGCSGTIIHKNGNAGYVLTAAHCIRGRTIDTVIECDNWDKNNNGTIDSDCRVFDAVAQVAHPGYESSDRRWYDFAIVTFTGATASTPVIPAAQLAQDSLVAGSSVEFSGFGLIDGLVDTSARHHVNGNLAAVAGLSAVSSDPPYVAYQNTVGPCSGDSGGPSFVVVGGAKYVAAVTSGGDKNCAEFGVSGRVSRVYTSFIAPVLSGDPPVETCETCQSGAASGSCSDELTACQNNADCTALVTCMNACAEGDSGCIQTCADGHPSGVTIINTYFTCTCGICSSLCESCNPGGCGFSNSGACGACLHEKCCDEGSACGSDATCSDCATGSGSAATCNANPAYSAFVGCLEAQCPSECGFSTSTSSSSAGPSTGSSSASGVGPSSSQSGSGTSASGATSSGQGGSTSNGVLTGGESTGVLAGGNGAGTGTGGGPTQTTTTTCSCRIQSPPDARGGWIGASLMLLSFARIGRARKRTSNAPRHVL